VSWTWLFIPGCLLAYVWLCYGILVQRKERICLWWRIPGKRKVHHRHIPEKTIISCTKTARKLQRHGR
jgi:hypothetical protein